MTGGTTGVIALNCAQTIGTSGTTGAIGIMTTTTAGRGPCGPCHTCRAEAVYTASALRLCWRRYLPYRRFSPDNAWRSRMTFGV